MLYKGLLGTQLSGSLDGIVASHNKGGTYFRNRAIPTNPNSSFQQTIRSAVSSLTSYWGSDLSQAQRDGWTTYAANVPITNRIGEAVNIGALAQFVRSNVPRLQVGLAQVDDAPTVFDLGTYTEPTIDAVDATADEIDIGFTNTDAWANEDGSAMLVYTSRPQNVTINFFKGPYRFAGSILGAGTPPTSPASIALPFAVVAGQRVFAKLSVTRADGRLSSPFRAAGTAA